MSNQQNDIIAEDKKEAEEEEIKPMKYKDFEDFLQEMHAKQYIGLDDEMPDDYEDWLDNLSIDDWIIYGGIYGEKKFQEGMGI